MVPREYKLPGFWVFIPGLLLGTFLAGRSLLGTSNYSASAYQFFLFVVPVTAGAASLAGLVCRLLHWRASVVLAVLVVGCYWVPVFYLFFMVTKVILSLSLMTVHFLAVGLVLLAILGALVALPTIAVGRIHWKGVLAGVLAAIICTYARFPLFPRGPDSAYTDTHAEFDAISSVRSLNVALDAYAKKYDRGFVDDLVKLGKPSQGQPDMNHADMMFVPQTEGFEYTGSNSFRKSGYIFIYTPKMDSSNRVATYSIVARPTGHGGIRSFYTDSTYVVRATRENRPAGPSDPPTHDY